MTSKHAPLAAFRHCASRPLVAFAAMPAARAEDAAHRLHRARDRPAEGLRRRRSTRRIPTSRSTGCATRPASSPRSCSRRRPIRRPTSSWASRRPAWRSSTNEGMLQPYAPAGLARDRAAVPRHQESAGVGRHGRVGRDDLLQHRRSGEEEHPEARNVEGPDQAGLQGPDRDAESGVVGHGLSSTSPPGCRSRARPKAGSSWTGCTRTSRSTCTRARARAPAAASGEYVVGISFEYRANAKRRRASRSTSCSRRKAWAGTWKPIGIMKGTKKLDRREEARSTGRRPTRRWSSTRRTSRSSRCRRCREPLPNVPADYAKLLAKNDFAWAAKNRDKILAEWTQALRRPSRRRSKRRST